MATIDENITEMATAAESSRGRVKHNFSRQHLVGARHFASLARTSEASGQTSEPILSEHRAYVSGAVVFSAAFLEASINELYLEAKDDNKTSLSGLSDAHVAVLAELWDMVEQHAVLGKYQVALAACGKERFGRGSDPYQGADGLVKIRNALIHYRPEWDDELEEHRNLRERLGRRFAANPLAPPGSLWFPHQCMGSACAEWAVTQAANFSDEFCKRLGIPRRTT